MTTRTSSSLLGKAFGRRAPLAIGCLVAGAFVGVAALAATHAGSAHHPVAVASVTASTTSRSTAHRVLVPAATTSTSTAPTAAAATATPVTSRTAALSESRVAVRRAATARSARVARRAAAKRTARAARLTAARKTARVAAHATPTTVPTTTATTATPTTTTPASTESDCAIALAYLAAHANPAYSQSCQPDPDNANAAQTNWVDGGSSGSIVIWDPACPASYENEASNSWFDFAALPSDTTSIALGEHDARGRTWDPYGACQ